MNDWTGEEHFHIQDVEHEIFIIGVKWPVLPWMVLSGLFFANFGFYFLLLAPTTVWYVARKYYGAQKADRPLEYQNRFLVWLVQKPVFVPLFRAAANIKHSRSAYK